MLPYLRDKGLILAIVTGKARRSLDISLQALQMQDYFGYIITGDDVINPKPHPEGDIKALSLLGITNNEAIFIGDSDADIEAGKEAHVHTIGVQWLADYQTASFSIQPDAYFDKIQQFLRSL